MPVLFLIIIGTAAGFLATRLMKIETDIPTTVAIGIFGALIGGFALRAMIAMAGFMAGLVGAVLGAILLIWLYKHYYRGR